MTAPEWYASAIDVAADRMEAELRKRPELAEGSVWKLAGCVSDLELSLAQAGAAFSVARRRLREEKDST